MIIRSVIEKDVQGLKAVLDTLELFPSEMLEDMISDYFTNQDSEDIWFTACQDDLPVAIAYCVPEKLTEGTFNLLALGVKPEFAGKGLGKKMMEHIEDKLRSLEHRMLIIETSSLAEFEDAQKFYQNLNFEKEAVIRDFWSEGDDKIVFRKKL